MKRIFFFIFLMAFFGNTFAQRYKVISLFDGKDLSGWQKYLAVPIKSLDINAPKDANGEYLVPLGFDNDPLNVFTVVTEDGQPAIKATGQVFGHIRTTSEYENYHLTVHFKWGVKKYAPREYVRRDAGVLYHSVGVPQKNAPWSQAQECQVQEGDCGDYYVIAGSSVDIRTDTTLARPFRYKPDGQLVTFDITQKRGTCKKLADFEKPYGEWNTIEIYTIGDKSLHLVNGHLVNVLQNSRMKDADGSKKPLAKGKIQLQSEGAEVFYRDITLQPIKEFPKEYQNVF